MSKLLRGVALNADRPISPIGYDETTRIPTRFQALNLLPPSVYYVRRFGYVKIGWSSQMGKRLTSLDVRDLLAFQPGTRQDEAATHHRFAHLRADGPGLGREHFHLRDELVDHINDLRSVLGLPHV